MKDHEVRELVDALTETAKKHEGCQSLRAAISRIVKQHLVNASIRESKKTQRVRQVLHGDGQPPIFAPAKQYPVDSQGRCIECQGWGCMKCCSSEAEIRACQGIFS